jgi:hypothetical protein
MVRADDACTVGVAIYGYVRKVLTTQPATYTDNDYTTTLTGSINPTASTAVVGVGTAFDTEIVVGDRITVSAETRQVTAITDATNLTVDAAFTDTANDTSPDVHSPETIPWRHLLNLNNDTVISGATNAIGGVNVICPHPTAAGVLNSIIYNEVVIVGGMYERLRAVPVVLTGTNVRCTIDLAYAGGVR